MKNLFLFLVAFFSLSSFARSSIDSIPECVGLKAEIQENLIRQQMKAIECKAKAGDQKNVNSKILSLIENSGNPKPTKRGAICIDCCGGPLKAPAKDASEEEKSKYKQTLFNYIACLEGRVPDDIYIRQVYGNSQVEPIKACLSKLMEKVKYSCVQLLTVEFKD